MDTPATPPRTGRIDVFRGALTLDTPHEEGDYPRGLMVVRPGPRWHCVIVPSDGDTIVALGGERAAGYTTPYGGEAQGFVLRCGDRATRVRSGLPHQLAEWRVERTGDS